MAYNDLRKKTPCHFHDSISQQEFEALALQIGRKIKRIKNIQIDGAVVNCTVESQTHFSEWNFTVDFNNWGHITGTFWKDSENEDSSIPDYYGFTLSDMIHRLLRKRNVYVHNMSDDVNNHDDLDRLTATGVHKNRSIWRYIGDEILGKKRNIIVKHSSWDMQGEHLYPIFAQLLDNGFENIVVNSIKDADNINNYYEYEVFQVSIGGNTTFNKGKAFAYNSNVIITYHTKKEIVFPFPVRSFKRLNYITAGDRLQELGFTNVYERKIRDLVAGILVKDGSTETIVVEHLNGPETPIQNGKAYPYDSHIIVCYHTFK